MKRFIAMYNGAAVRDTQICKEDPAIVTSEMDDVWEDWPDAPVYIGLFTATDEAGAVKAACETENCHPDCVQLVAVGDQEEFNHLLKFATRVNTWQDAERLRALWMAYCLHEAIEPEAPEYMAQAKVVYDHLLGDYTFCWRSFEHFVRGMSQWLC